METAMTREALETALLKTLAHPGYEYATTDNSRLNKVNENPSPPGGKGWELNVDTFPADGDDYEVAGILCGWDYPFVDRAFWRRKVRESTLEELQYAAIGKEINTDYEYDLIEGKYHVSTEHGNVAVRLAIKDHRLDMGWMPNAYHTHYILTQGPLLQVRVFRKR